MRSYRIGITYFLTSLLAVFFAGCGQETITLPTVVSTTPTLGATDIAIGTTVTATFSMAMNPATISATTFTVTSAGGPVDGTVTYSGTVATFVPSANLAYATLYIATITTGAANHGGSPLLTNYVWSFTTIAAPIPPMVIATVPEKAATGVPVNQVLSATFSEAMNCATLASPATAFTVTGPGATPVAGTVACTGSVATFTPGALLAVNTVYTATIANTAQSLAGIPLATSYVWAFLTVPAPTVPAVISTVPVNGAPAVATNQALTATFSEAMSSASINSATFLLTVTGGASVTGAVTYVAAGSTATFTPDAALTPDTVYTATITTGATALDGVVLAHNFLWSFTTAALPNLIPPTVISTIPADLATGVPINQIVSATFSTAMNPATIDSGTFTLKGPGTTSVSGLVAYAAVGNTLTFTPAAKLAPNTTFTASITTGAQALAGIGLVSEKVWTFTTGTAIVATSPELVSTVPGDTAQDVEATNVPLNQAVSATFTEAMNPLTLTSATFLLYQGTTASGTPILATITYDAVSFIATLTPTSPLTANTFYTATVTDGATDLAGDALGNSVPSPYTNPWTFETGTTEIPPPIILGPTIALFGGFAGSAGMTNTGLLTVIHGDSGTTATGFSSFTGFHDDTVLVAGLPVCVYTETPANAGLVTGKIYSPLVVPPAGVCPGEGTASTIATADTALAEATTAYTTLQGLPSIGVLAAELGNTTIPPGIYKNSSSVGITTGPVTLDAKGDPNAYWVFQIGSTLTVGTAADPASVILINGALASNVYWAVGTNVPHLNQSGGGTFQGTLIAYGSAGIAVSTVGSSNVTTVNGRLISLNASTTLVNTVINVP